YLAGFAVTLTLIYIPFGTIGGACVDLGGSAHLARTWYLASVVGAFLFLIGTSGATDRLPDLNPHKTFTLRAACCYLAALMMLASAGLAYATVRQMRALAHSRWIKDADPQGAMHDPGAVKVMRRGQKSQHRMIPTLFLRCIVAAGLLAVGGASVA